MEKRHTPRKPAVQAVFVSLLTDDNLRLRARVRDFSDEGLGLELSCGVRKDAAVMVEGEGCVLATWFRYCMAREGRFMTGLDLRESITLRGDPSLLIAVLAGELVAEEVGR